jgi:hypothetical protein
MPIKNVFEEVISQEEINEILTVLTKEKGHVEPNHGFNGAIGFYNLSVTNKHLAKIEKLVKSVVGDNIKFENSFIRIYKEGSALPFHIDRPGLDVSVSLCLRRDIPWPLVVSLKEEDEEYVAPTDFARKQESYRLSTLNYDLLPGSIVVVEGRKFPHWREKFSGNSDQCNTYVFFHWSWINNT